MSNLNKFEKVFLIVFIVLEIALFYFIMFSNLLPLNIVSYASIALCLIFSILYCKKNNDSKITILALFFTLIADTLLVLLWGIYREVAMIAFSTTQILYAIRLFNIDKNKIRNKLFIIIRIVIVCIAELIGILILKSNFDLLVSLTLFYIANLAVSVVHSFFFSKINTFFAFGLLLFICCDISLGLNYIGDYITIPNDSIIYAFIHSPINFTWLFYLPSQVLIALSVRFNKMP